MVNSYTSQFGVKRNIGVEEGADVRNQTAEVCHFGVETQVVSNISVDKVRSLVMPAYNKDKNNDGTFDSFGGDTGALTKGRVVKEAYIVTDAAFTFGVGDVVKLGTAKKDGTALDDDAFSADINAALSSVGVTAMSGAILNDVLANDLYIVATPTIASYAACTNGSAKLVVILV